VKRGQEQLDRVESYGVGFTAGVTYVAFGLLVLGWVMAPTETLYTVFVDTPARVAQTAKIFHSAAIRRHEHPNSWKAHDYPLAHHGVINAEPAMLGLDNPLEISFQFRVGREYRFVDLAASTELTAAAETTYVIDPAAESPWQPPLLKIDSRQPADLTHAMLEAFSSAGTRERHLVVITTATSSMLASKPFRDWLLKQGVDLAVFEGISRPALIVIQPESSVPQIPYVIASPGGFLFRF